MQRRPMKLPSTSLDARAGRMLRRVVLVAAVAVFAPVGLADAHQIDRDKARKVSDDLARSVCRDDNTCYGVFVEQCSKPTPHKARCKVHYWGEDFRGPYDCHWIDQWKVARDSNRVTWSRKVFNDTFKCRDGFGGHERARGAVTAGGDKANLTLALPRAH